MRVSVDDDDDDEFEGWEFVEDGEEVRKIELEKTDCVQISHCCSWGAVREGCSVSTTVTQVPLERLFSPVGRTIKYTADVLERKSGKSKMGPRQKQRY